MKKITALILAVAWRSVAVPVCCCFIATSLSSCSDQPAPSVTVGTVTVALTGLDDDLAGLDVQLRNISTGSTFVEQTDHQGTATFSVVPGLYEASTSQTRTAEGNEYYSYNGLVAYSYDDAREIILREAVRASGEGASTIQFRCSDSDLAISASTCFAVGVCICPSPFVSPMAPSNVLTALLGSKLATTEPKNVSSVRKSRFRL